MVFKNNIPQSTDFIDQSQVDILNNFAQLDTSMGIDHFNFSDSTGATGKHKPLHLPEIGSVTPPLSVPTTAADEGALYVKVGTNPAESNLFFRAESNGLEYQLTHVDSSNTTEFATNTTYTSDHTGGWTFLPGGLIYQYGIRTNLTTSGTITYPREFDTAVFTVVATRGNGNGSTVNVTSIAATDTFSFSVGNIQAPIHWYAIGK